MIDLLAEKRVRIDHNMAARPHARVEVVSTYPQQSYCTTVGEKIERIMLHLKYIQLFFAGWVLFLNTWDRKLPL